MGSGCDDVHNGKRSSESVEYVLPILEKSSRLCFYGIETETKTWVVSYTHEIEATPNHVYKTLQRLNYEEIHLQQILKHVKYTYHKQCLE